MKEHWIQLENGGTKHNKLHSRENGKSGQLWGNAKAEIRQRRRAGTKCERWEGPCSAHGSQSFLPRLQLTHSCVSRRDSMEVNFHWQAGMRSFSLLPVRFLMNMKKGLLSEGQKALDQLCTCYAFFNMSLDVCALL